MIVCNKEATLQLTGNGDCFEPEELFETTDGLKDASAITGASSATSANAKEKDSKESKGNDVLAVADPVTTYNKENHVMAIGSGGAFAR